MRISRLSDQERRILDLVAEGLTNRQIAERLYLAEQTVKNYVSKMLGKLGMAHRSEAAAFAARLSERESSKRPTRSTQAIALSGDRVESTNWGDGLLHFWGLPCADG